MIICIRLMGGLGNQMFQYAFGRHLALKYNCELVLDETLLLNKEGADSITTHREFELDVFKNLVFRWANSDEIARFNGTQNESVFIKLRRKARMLLGTDKLIIQDQNKIEACYFSKAQKGLCFVGRWQSYLFFNQSENQIKKDFQITPPQIPGLFEIVSQIHESESVCLHIRRGDLVTSSLYSKTIGVLNLEYYEKTINSMNVRNPNAVYFVFSDDIEWCRSNIKINKIVHFISEKYAGQNAEGHFYLMSRCKHFIISNSTFAWWAAFLAESNRKTVFFPKNWFRDKTLENPNMCPPDWIAI